ncbi:hypothetical protein BD560DRAFT_425698 [Blakeslea trispora]|nr:hypothetical protein BD560DRAFT_425698 [Blakeslea trispora]
MDSRHEKVLDTYFNNCFENDASASYEDFIKHCFVHIKSNINPNSDDEFSRWYKLYSVRAKYHNVKPVKGMALKMWYKLVLNKPRSSKSKKRDYMTANVIEKSVSETLENLKVKSLTSETSDMINSFNNFRRKSIDDLETKKDYRSLTSDLNLLLAIQGIIKIDSQTPAEFKSFGREKKSELYGIASRMPSQVKNEIEDALEEYRFDDDKKKLENKLMLISMNASGALERVVKVLLSLLSHMTVAKKDNNEMRLQSGPVASFGNLFKLSDNHDPHGYNEILFNTEALSNCRPDYVVSVGASDEDEVINLSKDLGIHPEMQDVTTQTQTEYQSDKLHILNINDS